MKIVLITPLCVGCRHLCTHSIIIIFLKRRSQGGGGIYCSDGCGLSLHQFSHDINLIFDNCIEYNGEDSEYGELAKNVKEMFAQLMKKHLGDGVEEEEASTKKKKKAGSRSPSKTPELTSESSSEEESESE